MLKNDPKIIKSLWALLFISILFRIVTAFNLPITLDEAYYQSWSQYIDWGYFDHPPAIAWLLSLSQNTSSPGLIRLPSLLLSIIAIPISLSLGRAWNLNTKKNLIATTIMSCSFFGLIFGVIPTPDVPLAFFWLLALHEAAYALKGNEKRWITAGIATGLGILGKYTMVTIGFVFLWPLLFKKNLRELIFPCLGGLACLLIVLPHLRWNANHDWVTFRFQFNRGLMATHDIGLSKVFKSPLPVIDPDEADLKGAALMQYFTAAEEKDEDKKITSPAEKFLKRTSSYIGAQLAIFGFFIPLIFIKRRKKFSSSDSSSDVSRLLVAGTAVPIGIFFLVALFQKVEANWAAPFLFSASLLLATKATEHYKFTLGAGLANLIVLTLLIMKGTITDNSIAASIKPGRIEKETHGYKELANLTNDKMYTFAESYQLASIIGYYRKWQNISQWPGLTRHSEWTRRQELTPVDLPQLKSKKSFELVTHRITPPHIPGFETTFATEVRDCFPKITITQAWESSTFKPECKKFLNRWYIYRYELK